MFVWIKSFSHSVYKLLSPELKARVRNTYAWLASSEFRQQARVSRKVFADFKKFYRGPQWFGPKPPAPKKTLLFVGLAGGPGIIAEVLWLKALQFAGFRPVILTRRDFWSRRFFSRAGIHDFIFWEDFEPEKPVFDVKERARQLSRLDWNSIIDMKYHGVKVGLHAASYVMRLKRTGFDPQDEETWELFAKNLAEAEQYAIIGERIVKTVNPDTAFLNERGYTSHGPLFDQLLLGGVDTLQYVGSHKDNALTLIRYNPAVPLAHPMSLSDRTWDIVCKTPWGQEEIKTLEDELYRCYHSGQWFGEVGTQFHKVIYNRDDLIRTLGVDPRKKTVVLFAHMFWDATFFYGKDIFRDYQDWFIQTIRTAINNPHLNWLIKVHPANTVKNTREHITRELAEMEVIRKYVGELPDHVKLIPVNSDINTYSLFSLMDYCLTVRGTIGIEAASFGIPVITAGTGRFDRRGFTVDPETVPEYLEILAHLEDIPPLTPQQRELAQRFAYASFILRPYLCESFSYEFLHDNVATLKVDVKVKSLRELLAMRDIRAFTKWFSSPDEGDYLDKNIFSEQYFQLPENH
jgi:hypothetical protein